MNWGEPWYAGFRESQTLYRFKNQLHFERNLMPHMLGWFALHADSSIEDAEWLLARAAGFDAGFALATSLASTAQLAADPNSADTAKRFGATLAILEAVKQWETARMARAFPHDIKALLRDNTREFHLEPISAGGWNLYPVHVERFTHDAAKAETTKCAFQNPNAPQRLQWVVRVGSPHPVKGMAIEINGKPALALEERSVPGGGALRYTGGSEALVCDSNWMEVARVPVAAEAVQIGTGAQQVTIGCRAQSGSNLKIELRTLGPATVLGGPTTNGRR
jgi:hypothetical protein